MSFAADGADLPDDIALVTRLMVFAARKSAVSGNTLLHLSVMLAKMSLEGLDEDFERSATLEIFDLLRRKKLKGSTDLVLRYGHFEDVEEASV